MQLMMARARMNHQPSGSNDPYWSNVVSLLHFDGNRIDVKGRVWSTSGSAPTYDSTVKKFGSSAIKITNSSTAVNAASSSDFAFGTADFTIECWVNPASIDNGYVFDIGSNGIVLQYYLSRWVAYTAETGESGSLYNSGPSVVNGAWIHLALSRNSGVLRAFAGGVQWGSQTSVNNFGSVAPSIGNYGGGGYGLTGSRIDDFRVTKGVGRYSSNFTPPTGPFPNSA